MQGWVSEGSLEMIDEDLCEEHSHDSHPVAHVDLAIDLAKLERANEEI